MLKIQNKAESAQGSSVLVIRILFICICFEFRYSNFGFALLSLTGETYELLKNIILPFLGAEFLKLATSMVKRYKGAV